MPCLVGSEMCIRDRYGTSPHYGNYLEYVNIATTGDSVDFGDLTQGRRSLGDPHISNGHGGLG